MMYMLAQILPPWNWRNKAKITQVMLIYVPLFVFVIVAKHFLSHLFLMVYCPMLKWLL